MMQYPKLVESKTSAKEVRLIEWNPGMDLLATVFENGALTCSRLLSMQRVWSRQPAGKIISVTWRPDGRVLAIASYDDKTKENVCTLHDVEDGKEIHSIKFKHSISSISWYNCSPSLDQSEKDDPIKPKKTLPPVIVQNDNFSHQLAHEQVQLNILLVSTVGGFVNFYALGLFYLGQVNLVDESDYTIHGMHMSSCMRFITTVIKKDKAIGGLKIINFDTFQRRSSEILKVAKMYAKITDELEYLEDTFNAIKTSWTDVLAGLDNKLSSYYSRRKSKLDDTDSSYTFINCDDLLGLLVIGYRSTELEKFLADMSDKGLRKLNNAIEQTCQRVQTLIVKNAQKCCYHLHNDLNLLRGMSLWRMKFSEVGLDDKSIVNAMRDVGSLMLKLTEMQQVIGHTLKSTKSFFRWLISIACRMSGEQNNSVVPNDVNKTTQQDVQLITDFILDNFDPDPDEYGDYLRATSMRHDQSIRPTCSNFTLEQVGQYLKNENLSRLKYSFTKPGSNFWIEFIKQRPHITEPKILAEDGSSVLLFYPHNENTSLIQDHKRACDSIATAFESVSSNCNKLMQESEFPLDFKDFLRGGGPANKVRVETDITTMRHYTLFQLSEGLVNKQYLLSLSLADKPFKFISIEFRSASSTHRQSRLSSSSSSNLVIADSCFYENKETKRMLLTFLLNDTSAGDTLLVQVELNKLLESSTCLERPQRDLPKIFFRSNEQIDRSSSQQILRIDLQTEPPEERKHDPEMMVKKIKGIAGKDMFASSNRGVIALTSGENKRVHIYELESLAMDPEMMDDEIQSDDKIDESLIDAEVML